MNRPAAGKGLEPSKRFEAIKKTILEDEMRLCPERALLVTDYFKKHDDRKQPAVIRRARALRHILENKSAVVYQDELIAGNVGSARKSCIIQPELAGVFMMKDLLRIGRRKTTPMKISGKNRLKLLFRVAPFWLFRNMPFRAFWPKIGRFVGFVADQLNATYYLINETGGIGHFLPGYNRVIRLGLRVMLEEAEDRGTDLYRAAETACEGIIRYAERLAAAAEGLSLNEEDPARKAELAEMARILRKVPAGPAETFHEAVQSLWLAHLAVCLEGINSAVSFGRVDQYLYPYYRKDLDEGRITPEQALDMLLSFCAKSTEHVFLLSEESSLYHGGYLVAQAAVVGGVDRDGNDATNDLTWLFLDVMEQSGLRDPNFHVRFHDGSPTGLLTRAAEVSRLGHGVPSFFSDRSAVSSLEAHGYPAEDARDYGIVGCVEMAVPGKSFLSTDAALFNLPVCLELALNRGRLMRNNRRVGALTPDSGTFSSMADLIRAFTEQVDFMVNRLVRDIRVIEQGNRDFHPTPFSSLLVEGCLESGKDLTAGGARYNSSGIQGVGVADAADSLAAVETALFRDCSCTMNELVAALKRDFKKDGMLRALLLKAPKFGNDEPIPDRYADLVVKIFHRALSRHLNTRGGPYVPGFYSSTTHVAFGKRTGALPSGRLAGRPFSASLGPVNGMDRQGPTAVLNSVARVDADFAPNGYALNLMFSPMALSEERSPRILGSLIQGYFNSGGMQVQFNVVSPETLMDAREHPGKYPSLVVRVAGYLACFDDLPDPVKGEIIDRTRQGL